MKLGIETGLAADKKKEVPVVLPSSFAALCQLSHKGRTSHMMALKPCETDPTHASYFERHLPIRRQCSRPVIKLLLSSRDLYSPF